MLFEKRAIRLYFLYLNQFSEKNYIICLNALLIFRNRNKLMDIETTGVKKYAFQDLVCISLLLNIHSTENIQFFVEPENSEDAKVVAHNLNGINEIEIQVKGSQDSVTPTNLAQHLAHFPKGKAENCLYDRLLSNPHLLVVFVMTGRCNDATSPFLSTLDNFYIPHKTTNIKKENVKAIINEFKNVKTDTTESKLTINRKNYINGLYNKYKILEVRKAFERLIIIEQTTDSSLLKNCYELLRMKYSIPDDNHQSVIERLKTVIFDGKSTKQNIFDIFRDELSKFIPENIYPTDYIKHGIEGDLKKILSKKNALLITGSPRIGKTYMSRWIAAEYSKLGFEIKETSDVAEASRFIMDPTSSKRLVLIDDPFGAAHPIQNSSHAYQQFELLLSRLSSNRKAIVAQVQDRLVEVANPENIDELNTGNHNWFNLNNIQNEFSNKLWLLLSKKYHVQNNLKEIVSTKLLKNELSLEAGCLEYLAIHSTDLKENFNLDDIKRLAHNNAKNLANALENEGYKSILRALAITTNHNIDISILDLAYVLYNRNEDEYLSISDYLGTSSSFLSNERFSNKDKIITKYNPENNLSEQDDNSLEKLEFRKIVNCENSNNYLFTHPFYRSAAEYLISKTIARKETEIIDLVRKGIFCLSPKTSRATARNLDWIYYGLKGDESRNTLVNLAIKSLKSSFPSTRDISFSFLINNYSNLPITINKNLESWGYDVSMISLDDAEWINGEPIYPMGQDTTLDTTKDIGYYFSFSSYNPQNDSFLANKDYITPEEAWDFLRMIEKIPEILNHHTMSKLLSYDEALIRAKAAKIWLKTPRNNDNFLLDQIFIEIHPSIAKNTLKSIILVWNKCTEERKSILLNGLIKLASHPINAYVMLEDLIIFNRDDRLDVHPWDIFASLLPTLLESIPNDFSTSDHRLYDIVNTSIHYLETTQLIPILKSWVNWLEKKVTFTLPTDYAFGVTTLLVKITIKQPHLRFNLIERLLNLHGTGATVRVIHDLVADWENLIQNEKKLIINKLNENRIDKYWLQATALVQNNIPEELQQLLLPHDIILDKPESLFTLDKKNNDLFLAVIQMYLGHPQPLWYLGTHHRGKKYWKSVIEQIIKDSAHPLFNKAWEEIYSSQNDHYVASFVKQLCPADVEKVFEILLTIKINTTDNYMPETWNLIFLKIEDPLIKSRWLKQIASYSNEIFDNLSQINKWLIDSKIKEEFWGYFRNDIELVKISYTLHKYIESNITSSSVDELPNNFLKNNLIEILIKTFRKSPPKHYSSCEILKNSMADIGADHTILDEIMSYKSALIQKRNIKTIKEDDIEIIQNWIE